LAPFLRIGEGVGGWGDYEKVSPFQKGATQQSGIANAARRFFNLTPGPSPNWIGERKLMALWSLFIGIF